MLSASCLEPLWLFLLRHGSEEDVFEGGDLLLAQLGVGYGFAGDYLVALGGVVEEDGFDGGELCEISRLQSLVRIHVRVIGAALVVCRVLDELETREPDRVV